jgi:hypothetical protein
MSDFRSKLHVKLISSSHVSAESQLRDEECGGSSDEAELRVESGVDCGLDESVELLIFVLKEACPNGPLQL